MIALPTDDETLLQDDEAPISHLAEQLIGFANEVFVFSDASMTRRAAESAYNPARFPAPPQAYFADVAPPPLNHWHLKNAQVVASREQILSLLPKGGACG